MSETSHAAGRIAILAAFTLLFAVAWRSDSPVTSRLVAPLTASKRSSGAIGAGCADCISNGPDDAAVVSHGAFRVAGMLAQRAARETLIASPFSGTPALLGRSAIPQSIDGDSVATAAVGDGSPAQ